MMRRYPRGLPDEDSHVQQASRRLMSSHGSEVGSVGEGQSTKSNSTRQSKEDPPHPNRRRASVVYDHAQAESGLGIMSAPNPQAFSTRDSRTRLPDPRLGVVFLFKQIGGP